MPVADLRKELCENESGGFLNAQLSEESTSSVKAFRALNLGDEDRPAKRQKTLPASPDDVNSTTYNRLIMILNGSTPDSPVLDTTDLSNTIQ